MPAAATAHRAQSPSLVPFVKKAAPAGCPSSSQRCHCGYTSRRLGAARRESPGRAAQYPLLLRDLFGTSIRPARLASAWRTPAVVALAQTASDERGSRHSRLLGGGLHPRQDVISSGDRVSAAGVSGTEVLATHARFPASVEEGLVLRWRPRLLLLIVLDCALLLVVCVSLIGPRLRLPESPIREEWRAEVERLRQRYAYESLADRLAYEEKAEKKPAPRLSTETRRRLAQKEKEAVSEHAAWRTERLRRLHALEVDRFIKENGLGVERLIGIGSIPVDPVVLIDDEDAPRLALPRSDNDNARKEGPGLPTPPSLLKFHDNGASMFANPSGFGHVQSRERVAGFRSHHFWTRPSLDAPASSAENERWLIARLELVSLLKYDRPAVYISANLPRMEDARKARTRPLTAFEAEALGQLDKGEDLATEATANRIRILGAVRALGQCLDCHQVERGALLGAFSYDLRRDPPSPTSRHRSRPGTP
jgi:hypothetical protein